MTMPRQKQEAKASIGVKTDPIRTLTLAEGKISRRADALFKTLATDYLLREQFVTDPAQILSDYLFGQHLPAASVRRGKPAAVLCDVQSSSS